MMLYIKALGFSKFDTRDKAEKLVQEVIDKPTNQYYSELSDGQLRFEYYKSYNKNFGLVVRGEMQEDGEINVHSIIPCAKNRQIIETHEINVVENEDMQSFSGYCEEMKSGTPISFYLQNIVDYFDIEDEEDISIHGVSLSLFAVEGTVVLPVERDEEEEEFDDVAALIREELLEQARDGDEDAMDALEEEALEATKLLRERLKSEDLLTILEGFFIPIGESEDVYSVLGTIRDAKKLTNRITKETVWRLKLECMNMSFDVYVNKIDLVGEPSKGMRFKGTAWVHGKIDFDFGLDEFNDN